MRRNGFGLGCTLALILAAGVFVNAQDKPAAVEQERSVKEKEVPAAALASLKKLAAGAAFTEFAEEIEDGHTFYEGSWKGPDGNVDVLVTDTGELVEIEEEVPSAKVPASVRAEAEKEAGVGANLTWEKKTMVLYEVHFKKNGKGREIILTPDGRRYHEGAGDKQDKDEDEDEK